MKKQWFLLLFAAASAFAQRVDIGRQGRNFDFSTATVTKPVRVGDAIPETCQVGELFFWRLATPGQNLNACTAQNVWTTLSGQTAGAGAHRLNELKDWKVEIISPVQARLGGECTGTDPCVARIGNRIVTLSAPANMIIQSGSGSGTAYVYLASDGNLKLDYPSMGGLSVQCVQCTGMATANPSIPADAIAIASLEISNGVLQSVLDLRALLAVSPVVAGTGLTAVMNQGILTLGLEGHPLARLSQDNVWGGSQDFSSSPSLRVPSGVGMPASASCGSASQVGALYARREAAGSGATLYVCANTGTGSYSWELTQGSGSGGSSALEVQAAGSAIGQRGKLNFTPGSGAVLQCSDDALNSRINCAVSLDTGILNATHARIGAPNVYAAGFLQDFSAAQVRLPASASFRPSQTAHVGFDTNTNSLSVGRNGSNAVLAFQDMSLQPLTVSVPNSSEPATVLWSLAKLNSSGQATLPEAGASHGVVGVVAEGAGSSGSASIAVMGQVSCTAENATSTGSYVGIGISVAGRCRDVGSTYPSSGQVIGRWMSSVGPGQQGNVILFGPGHQASSAGVSILTTSLGTMSSGNQYASFCETGVSGTPATRHCLAPVNGVASRLFIAKETASGASFTCTLQKNDADTTLAVTVSSGSLAGSDTIGSVSFSAGDKMGLRCNATGSTANVRGVSIVYTL